MPSGDNLVQIDPHIMNSILIIAHAPLASALRSAALHAFPEAAARVAVIDVPPTQSPDVTLGMARALLHTTAQGLGVTGTLVMSDVFGATPCNVAKQLVTQPSELGHVQCVAGTSLPMLLRAITYWDEPLAVMAEKALLGASLGAVAVT
jgi:PTS system ascorbate-specific IIA component